VWLTKRDAHYVVCLHDPTTPCHTCVVCVLQVTILYFLQPTVVLLCSFVIFASSRTHGWNGGVHLATYARRPGLITPDIKENNQSSFERNCSYQYTLLTAAAAAMSATTPGDSEREDDSREMCLVDRIAQRQNLDTCSYLSDVCSSVSASRIENEASNARHTAEHHVLHDDDVLSCVLRPTRLHRQAASLFRPYNFTTFAFELILFLDAPQGVRAVFRIGTEGDTSGESVTG